MKVTTMNENAGSTQPPQSPAAGAKKRRRRWPLVVVMVLAAIVMLVALAPTILSTGALRRPILKAVSARLPVAVSAEDWSLSWFGSQEIRGLAVQAADTKVARADKVILQQGLLSLLRDASHIGLVRIEGGEVWMEGMAKVRKAASEKPSTSKPPGPGNPPTLPQEVRIAKLTVHGGSTTVVISEGGMANATGSNDQVTFNLPLELATSSQRGTATAGGTLDGLRADWKGWNFLGVTAQVACKELPLDGVWAIVADLGVSMSGSGTLTGDIHASLGRNGDVAATLDCQGENVGLVADFLQGDRPVLKTLRLAGQVTYTGVTGAFDFKDLVLESPVASARASGGFTLASLDTQAPQIGGSVKVTADVARLAAMLPHTMRLPQGVTVQSGMVAASVDAQWTDKPGSKERVLALRLSADVKDVRGEADLKNDLGVTQRRPIAMSPIAVAADIEHIYAAAPAADPPADTGAEAVMDFVRSLNVKNLVVSGPFGQVTARGRLELFSLRGQLDLSKAMSEVSQFVDLAGYGGRGAANLYVESTGDFQTGVQLTTTASFQDLLVSLGPNRQWAEDKATLQAKAGVKFDKAYKPVAVSIEKMDFRNSAARASVTGTLSRSGSVWSYALTAEGGGDLAWLADAAELGLNWTASAPPPAAKGAAPAAGQADWKTSVRELLQSFRSKETQAARGQWQINKATVTSAEGKRLQADVDLQVTDLAVGPEVHLTAPLNLKKLAVAATVSHDAGAPWHIAVGTLDLQAPQVALKARGDVTLPDDFATAGASGNLSASAAGDLFWLSGTLRKLEVLPTDYALAGTANLTVTAATDAAGRRTASAVVTGDNIQVALGEGRLVRQDHVVLKAAASAAPDAAGNMASADIGPWTLTTDAGEFTGTASLAHAADKWTYTVTAAGKGEVAPLVQTIAVLTGKKPQAISGRWTLASATYAETGEGRTMEIAASATDLVTEVPALSATTSGADAAPAEPAAPQKLRLADASIAAAATLSGDGMLTVSRAAVTAPGLAAKLSGSARFPRKPEEKPAPGAPEDKLVAGGRVEMLKADLAELSNLLRPLGLLPEDCRLAGAATLTDAKVSTDAAGLISGSGVLDATNLDVRLLDQELSIQEAALHAPVTFAYQPATKELKVAAQGLKSDTASGNVDGTVRWGEKSLAVDVKCDLACDGQRLTQVAAHYLPKDFTAAGALKVKATVATDAAGLISGSGVLDAQDLDVRMPDQSLSVQEAAPHVPVTFSYQPATKELKGSIKDLKTTVASGSLGGTLRWSDTALVVDVKCDLACDGQRLTQIAAHYLPTNLTATGALKVRASAAGPLPNEGSWNKRIAGLAGSGEVDVTCITYNKIPVENGTIIWRQADGQIVVGTEAGQPCKVSVAGGTANLGGRLDLRGEAARVIIDKPLVVLQNASLGTPGIAEHLKHADPMVGASVDPKGRVTVTVQSLDLPLDSRFFDKAAGLGRFQIDDFQATMSGAMEVLMRMGGGTNTTPLQTYGPVLVTLKDKQFTIAKHQLLLQKDLAMTMSGTVGLDERVSFQASLPLTKSMLGLAGANASAVTYLENQELLVALTGTIDKLQMDEKALRKHIADMIAEALKREFKQQGVKALENLLKGGK
jgi:hypothetical protein